MKFLFLVQGEGRGHMTQAISIRKILESQGHQVLAGIGKNSRRKIPRFFADEFGTNLFEYESPNFFLDKKEKGIRIGKTIFKGLINSRKYFKQLNTIQKEVKLFKPDAAINFFEPLFGLYNLIYRPKFPVYGIAHQFLYIHPEFIKPKGKKRDMLSMEYLSKIAGLGCHRLFALSFYDLPAKGKIIVCPPILRKQIFNLNPENEDFLLSYILNPGYLEEVKSWSKSNPGVKIRCFTDSIPEETQLSSGNDLTLYGLSGTKFLEFLSKCRGLATSSGFESVCEAMYLGKPVLMIPVKNHYEQFVNSRDGQMAGAGIVGDHFNFDDLIKWVDNHKSQGSEFKKWVDGHQNRMLNYINSDLKE